ncbi:hypothetical protein MNBD_GAMMA06-967 [hydrothermal vent metagenome]|uniref:Uncharacterized protein n=1 Tax=hydrothermal vent metagenome TaxID=652676 RepID=A0A3B0WNQ3_9ZZZZ
MIFSFCGEVIAMGKITPSDVYQQTDNVIAEIILIRKALNVQVAGKNPGLQFNKKPLHVLTKSIELQEKIATAQEKNNVKKTSLSVLPLRKITPEDVLASALHSLDGLRKLKAGLGINEIINDAPLIAGKSPSDVYENMWRASYLMDAVSGAISPNDVFRNTKVIQADLKFISEHLGVSPPDELPIFLEGMTPKDANIEGYKNLHRIYRLQKNLKMQLVRVSDFPVGKASPSDVYDTTNTILGELVRIKIKIGLNKSLESFADFNEKTPSDVHKELRTIGILIEQLTNSI